MSHSQLQHEQRITESQERQRKAVRKILSIRTGDARREELRQWALGGRGGSNGN